MSRFDEEGRQLVLSKISTMYRVDTHKQLDGSYTTDIGAEGTNMYMSTVDLTTGHVCCADSPVISPSYEALTNMEIYDQSIADAYHAMMDECFDVYDTTPYNEAVEALNDDII